MLGPQKDSLFRRTIEIFNTLIEPNELFAITDILDKYNRLYENKPLTSLSCFRDIINRLPEKVNKIKFGQYKKLGNISDEDIKYFYRERNLKYPPFGQRKKHIHTPSSINNPDKEDKEDQSTINSLLKNITEIGQALVEAQQRIAELEQQLNSKQENTPNNLSLINTLIQKIEEKTNIKLNRV